jgi:hypothetical protein
MSASCSHQHCPTGEWLWERGPRLDPLGFLCVLQTEENISRPAISITRHVKAEVQKWLREQGFSFYRQGLEGFILRYDKCLSTHHHSPTKGGRGELYPRTTVRKNEIRYNLNPWLCCLIMYRLTGLHYILFDLNQYVSWAFCRGGHSYVTDGQSGRSTYVFSSLIDQFYSASELILR